ncbi:ABC transporter permease [Sulfitobacter sp. M57]|uniref:ABC transporter permease n=1 Tax=unclassified Sulfitobacter TaxID=196795 RepID=UPI0023E2A43B|nr:MULTISPECIES: ABC transporter permease [unclassified Sulfitobacter]MDF3433131.1 ABC transporter permease [Sulfitobacter sp. KE42]MDF3540542.1 ABC transporter permease [Sulfitobacter sp. M62]MDF3414584.1 ABC transporter permease [Sulfitobacter sp. KE5]MDF3422066.1 ABC transporter permease [Sulfitobacter sp. KE43]MDF3458771.1 ABC transporter permease [Sulfitobacter sp. S74]
MTGPPPTATPINPVRDRQPPPGLRRILGRELRQIATRPALAFMLAPMPMIIFLALAAVFAPGLPRELPVAVVDLDGTTLSRQVVRMVDAASDVAVAQQVPNLSEARQALVAREAYAILVIPQDLERNLQLGQSPEVVIFSNSQFLQSGGTAARSMATSVSTFAAGASLRLLETRGIGTDRAMDLITPIPVQQSPLFNPSLDYIQFLLSAIVPTVMQIFICAAAVLSFSRERHSTGGMSRLMRLAKTPTNAIIGKLLPYTVLGTLVLLFGDVLLFTVFGADFRGNVPVFFLNGLLFILACQALGALIAMIAQDTTGALGMMAVIVAPAFGFAGVSFPRFGMTEFSQAWGAVIPLTPYLELRTDQTLRGAPLEYSLPTMAILFALLVVFATLLWITLRKAARLAATTSEVDL